MPLRRFIYIYNMFAASPSPLIIIYIYICGMPLRRYYIYVGGMPVPCVCGMPLRRYNVRPVRPFARRSLKSFTCHTAKPSLRQPVSFCSMVMGLRWMLGSSVMNFFRSLAGRWQSGGSFPTL